MRTTEVIDAELRLLAAYRRARAAAGRPVRSTRAADALLEERSNVMIRGKEMDGRHLV